jgi:hypothetical protein
MSDPRRMVDDQDDLSEVEKGALAAARADRPRTQFVDGVWTALVARIAPMGPASPGQGPSGGPPAPRSMASSTGTLGATASAGTIAVVKAAAVGAVIAAVALIGRTIVTQTPTPTQVPSTSESQVASPTGAVPGQGDPRAAPIGTGAAEPQVPAHDRSLENQATGVEPGVEASRLPNPVPRAPAGGLRKSGDRPRDPTAPRDRQVSPESSSPASGSSFAAETPEDIRAETGLVAAGREALRAGHLAAATGLLEQARQRFPQGVLRQEREALAIEALVQSGQRELAVERARTFFRSYPDSPHSARVQAVIAAH